jgi:hypothetical protein
VNYFCEAVPFWEWEKNRGGNVSGGFNLNSHV